MRKQFGTSCTLTIEFLDEARLPEAGCVLISSGGSAYGVLVARSVRGNPRKLRLACVRIDPDSAPTDVERWHFVWNERPRKRPVTSTSRALR